MMGNDRSRKTKGRTANSKVAGPKPSKGKQSSSKDKNFHATLGSWQCVYCDEPCEDNVPNNQKRSIECFTCKKYGHQECAQLSDSLTL